MEVIKLTEQSKKDKQTIEGNDILIKTQQAELIRQQDQINSQRAKIEQVTNELEQAKKQYEQTIGNKEREICLLEEKLNFVEATKDEDSERYQIEKLINSFTGLAFNFQNERVVRNLRLLSHYKLPALDEIQFYHPQALKQQKVLKDFLSTSLCHPIKECHFNFLSKSLPKIPLLQPTLKILPLVTEVVAFDHCSMTKTEFEDVLAGARNTKEVWFEFCRILTDSECDFRKKLKGATFECLRFMSTGRRYCSDWSANGYLRFRNIMKGLAKVESVRDRKVILYLDDCGLEKEKVEGILNEYLLVNMEVLM